ncbi:MAG TPA: hypothetical protein VLK24_01960 [Gaiellaceae bacterium]|nr:hypothetical protein [Gaiellaceae bacterium]
MTRVGILGEPRPYPERQRWLGPAAGALVIAFALPLFLIADWPLKGWAAAALLWIGAQALGLLLSRAKPSSDNLAASGLRAFGMMTRLLIVLAVLLALVASDKQAGLAATLVYGAAYTVELGLSLLGYYSQEPRA